MGVAPDARAAEPRAGLRARLERALAAPLLHTVLRTYAQLLFSRSRTVGALLLLATACVPRAFVAGLFSIAAALGLSRALRLSPEQTQSGHLLFSSLLVGLGGAALGPQTVTGALLVLCAVLATVLLTVALESALASALRLPALTLPFLLGFYALLAALAGSAAPRAPLGVDPWLRDLVGGPNALARLLQSLGSLLFLPRIDAGAFVFAALVWHSRVATALAVTAFALVTGALAPALGLHDVATVYGLALNAMLVAMGLGAVWFIPSPSSYLLALFGVALCTVLELALAPSRTGVPALIVPFNLTTLLVLFALRHRIADGAPHFVDFAPGTPEQNLAYFHARRERFGAVHGLRLAAPFRGRWTCTQGVSGGLTHEGPWRHALDFEVLDEGGRVHREQGASLAEFYCYRLPVLAVAPGVVVRVVDGVCDNAPGEVNLEDNWGNVVVLQHGPALFSCVAHLSPGTIAVREGQHVAAGALVGLCGNSGRSATPHLHLQLQASAAVGAPTIELALHDVVDCSDAGRSEGRAVFVPRAGESVRNVVPEAERAKLLRFEYGVVLEARVRAGVTTRVEHFVPEIDLLGRYLLRAVDRVSGRGRGGAVEPEGAGDALYYEPGTAAFTVHDVIAHEGSALHALRIALSRVLYDADEALTWSDALPLRPFLSAWMRPLYDVLAPLGAKGTLAMQYTARRSGASLLIEGASLARRRDGSPRVRSRACLAPAGAAGLVSIEVEIDGARTSIELAPARASASTTPAPALASEMPAAQTHVSSDDLQQEQARNPTAMAPHDGPALASTDAAGAYTTPRLAPYASRLEGGISHG